MVPTTSVGRPVSRRSTVQTLAMKLYTAPNSRGGIIQWYLQERDIDAEVINVNLKDKEHKQDAFLLVNPFGKVPALVDGKVKLFESGAILLYLADRCGDLPDAAHRGNAAKWVLFANSSLANGLFLEQFRDKQAPELLGALDKILTNKEYLEGASLTVSDVAVGSYLLYLPAFVPQFDLSPYPHVLKYMQRLAARPACAASVGANVASRKDMKVPPTTPAAKS